jgi:AmiR/NasT family two-component response regulator
MAFSATRSIHHPLAALEAQVVDLQQRLAIKEAEIVAEQNRRSSERKAYERLRNENMRLSAAISEAEGAVSKIGSESMWKKEASI